MSEINHYFVVSPEIEFYPASPGADPGDPPEYACCVASVAAANKREAIKSAVKHPEMRKWVDLQRADGQSPFVGLKAEDARCPHGVCTCELCPEFECSKCDAEAEAADATN